jgi:hypothetical protein
MSHHVARLIEEARTAKPKDRAAAEENCRRAILELWRHRRSLTDRTPFASIDRIAELIFRLRAPHHGWYFNRIEERGEPGDTALQLALATDGAARQIIRWCLAEAFRDNLLKEVPWLTWTSHELFEGELDVKIARDIVGDLALFSPQMEGGEELAEARKDVLQQLDWLASFAASVRDAIAGDDVGDDGDGST